MSQDLIADTLNMLMSALKARKNIVETKRYSKLLLSTLAIAKLKGYVKDYKAEEGVLKIEIGKLTGCGAIKPRLFVKVPEIEKYILRFLPARNLGVLIISTTQGLMTNQTAEEKEIGGSLIAYFY